MEEKKSRKGFVIFVVVALIFLTLNNIRMTLNQHYILKYQDTIILKDKKIITGIDIATKNQKTLLDSMKVLADNQKLTGKSLNTISQNQILLQRNQETILNAVK